jgi:hypothetical protein
LKEPPAGSPLLVGGIASQQIDAWILALRGERKTESMADSKAALTSHGVKGLEAMLHIIEAADLDSAPADACSLHLWLDRARQALSSTAENS